jgi:L-lactate utilization protein LutB
MDREALLDRLAARLHRRRGAPVQPVPRRRSLAVPPAADRDALVRRFAERLRDLGGEALVVADRKQARLAVERLVAERRLDPLTCPPGLRWPTIETLCGGELAAAAFGLNEPRWAIAETGSVVLWHDGAAPRTSSLLPPVVGFFLPASRIVARLGEVLDDVAAAGQAVPACITFMSGPSRSMDIGYESCVGVHGPGETMVWILADE